MTKTASLSTQVKAKIRFLQVSILMLVSACKGDGKVNADLPSGTDLSDLGSGPNQIDITSAMASLTGTAVKGPLSNAFVFLDKHTETKINTDTGLIELDAQGNEVLIGNGIRDKGEAFAYTEQDGSYSIEIEIEEEDATSGYFFWNDHKKTLDYKAGNSASTSSKETYSLAVKTLSTTIDASSGQPLPGVTLSAPIDAKVISPFTTIMNIGGLTSDEINVKFGIDDQNQINFKDFNPYKSFSLDEINSGIDTQAIKVENIAQQIVAVTTSIAGSLEASSLTPDAAYNIALHAVISEIENSTSLVDLSTRTTLNKIANTAKVTAESEHATSFDALLFEEAQDPLLTALTQLNDELKNVTELRSIATSEIYSKISNLGAKVNSSIEEGKISGNYQISFDKADFGTKLDLNLGRTIPETSLSQEEFSNGFTQPIYIDPLHTNQTELRFTTNPSLEVQVEANKLILSGVPSSDEIIQLTLGGTTISLRIDEVIAPINLQNVADQLKEKLKAEEPGINVMLSDNVSNIELVLTRGGQEVSLNNASPIIIRSENLNLTSEYFDAEVFQTDNNNLISVSSFSSSGNGAVGLVVELFPGPTAFYDASSRYFIHRENVESIFHPAITNLGNDKFLVSWNSSIPDEEGIDIDAQFFEITPNNNLSPTSLVFSVNQISAKTEHNASMAMDDNGDVLSAWTAEIGGGVSEIIGGQFTAAGARLGPQIIEEKNLELKISRDTEKEGHYKVVTSDGSQLVSSGIVSFSGNLPSINLNPDLNLQLYNIFSDMSVPAASAIPGISYSDLFSKALNISESKIDIAVQELLNMDWSQSVLSEFEDHKTTIFNVFDENGSLIDFEYIPATGTDGQLVRRKFNSDGDLEEMFYEATLLGPHPYNLIIDLAKPETYSEDKFYFGNRIETKITPLTDILRRASDDHIGIYGEIEFDKYSGNYSYKIDKTALDSIFLSDETQEVTETYKWLKTEDFLISSGFGGLNYSPKTLITNDGQEYVLWLIDTSHISQNASPFQITSVTNQFVKGQKVKLASDPLDIEIIENGLIVTGTPMAGDEVQITLNGMNFSVDVKNYGIPETVEDVTIRIQEELEDLDISDLRVVEDTSIQGKLLISKTGDPDFVDTISVEVLHSHSGSSDQTDTYIAIDDLDMSNYPNMSDSEIISNKSNWVQLSEHSQLMIAYKDAATGEWSQAVLGTKLGEAVTSFAVEKIDDDNAFIAWNKTNDDGTAQIMVSTVDLSLNLEELALDFEKNEFLVSENAETNLSNPNLLASDDGKMLISWLGNSQEEPSQEELFYTEFALNTYLEDLLPLEGVII